MHIVVLILTQAATEYDSAFLLGKGVVFFIQRIVSVIVDRIIRLLTLFPLGRIFSCNDGFWIIASILTLKFNEDDTFTIAYNGKLLGVVHGEKTGVNFLSEDSEYTVWKLVDAENGAYYLQNVNEGTYLKWFNGPKNWTSGTDNTASKEYLIQLERVD